MMLMNALVGLPIVGVAATILARFGAPSVKALLGAYGWRASRRPTRR